MPVNETLRPVRFAVKAADVCWKSIRLQSLACTGDAVLLRCTHPGDPASYVVVAVLEALLPRLQVTAIVRSTMCQHHP